MTAAFVPFLASFVAFLLGRTCSTDCELFHQQWHCPSSMRRRILQRVCHHRSPQSRDLKAEITSSQKCISPPRAVGKTLPTPYSLHTKTSDLSIVHLDDTIYDIASRFYIIGPHSNPPSRLVPFFFTFALAIPLAEPGYVSCSLIRQVLPVSRSPRANPRRTLPLPPTREKTCGQRPHSVKGHHPQVG